MQLLQLNFDSHINYITSDFMVKSHFWCAFFLCVMDLCLRVRQLTILDLHSNLLPMWRCFCCCCIETRMAGAIVAWFSLNIGLINSYLRMQRKKSTISSLSLNKNANKLHRISIDLLPRDKNLHCWSYVQNFRLFFAKTKGFAAKPVCMT